jgi:glutamate/tyrosine decarboxylase-like PLP-dependent enzyme
LFRDPSVGKYYQHDSPYTYFSSDELHLGEISLECSRAGASAVALWATMRHFPLDQDGVFAKGLMSSHMAALKLYQLLSESSEDRIIIKPETDIVIWAPKASTASETSRLSQLLFDNAARQGLHLATIKLPSDWLIHHWQDLDFDSDSVLCMRSCLMKAEHYEWIERIWQIYSGLERNSG